MNITLTYSTSHKLVITQINNNYKIYKQYILFQSLRYLPNFALNITYKINTF